MGAPAPPSTAGTAIERLLVGVLGLDHATTGLRSVHVPPVLAGPEDPAAAVPRATIAHALALTLFHDLCRRVPSAEAYRRDRVAAGRRLILDHGAVRTVAGPSGALPAGQASVTRLLQPLGYEHRSTYDLTALRMTGRSWTHLDHPEDVPQWFVSELHLDRLTDEVQGAAAALLGSSVDPLERGDLDRLARVGDERSLPGAEAVALVVALVRCFGRQHAEPTDRDHDLFARRSAELAWIATEGTTCNHWTDRVPDVTRAAEAERAAGRPVKESVEVSGSGRVRQTAHRAAMVERAFHTVEGRRVLRQVPGSFFELIERAPQPDGSGLDLAFDAANATGIFAMTRPARP